MLFPPLLRPATLKSTFQYNPPRSELQVFVSKLAVAPGTPKAETGLCVWKIVYGYFCIKKYLKAKKKSF